MDATKNWRMKMLDRDSAWLAPPLLKSKDMEYSLWMDFLIKITSEAFQVGLAECIPSFHPKDTPLGKCINSSGQLSFV